MIFFLLGKIKPRIMVASLFDNVIPGLAVPVLQGDYWRDTMVGVINRISRNVVHLLKQFTHAHFLEPGHS